METRINQAKRKEVPKASGIWLRFIRLPLVVLCACTVFGHLGWYHRLFEIPCHFRAQYFFGFLICGAISWFIGARRWAIVGIIGLSWNLILLAPWYFTGDQVVSIKEVAAEKILNVFIANLHTSNQNYGAASKAIQGSNADVVVLMEVNSEWLVSLEEIEKEYQFFKKVPRDDNFGIAVYSKIPLHDVSVAYFGGSLVPSIEAGVTWQNREFHLIAAHPIPPISSRYFERRNEQLQAIAESIRRQDKPVVLAGDLNVTMWSPHYHYLIEITGLLNARKGFGIQPSWPSFMPIMGVPIDHCLFSKEFQVRNFQVLQSIGSDHYPLEVELIWKKDPNLSD